MPLHLQVKALRGVLQDRNYEVNQGSLHLYFHFSNSQCSSIPLGDGPVIHRVVLFRGDLPRRCITQMHTQLFIPFLAAFCKGLCIKISIPHWNYSIVLQCVRCWLW
jgi:hypothetical protein